MVTLLDSGASLECVERTASYGKHAIHAAAEGGHYEIVKLMQDRGFQVVSGISSEQVITHVETCANEVIDHDSLLFRSHLLHRAREDFFFTLPWKKVASSDDRLPRAHSQEYSYQYAHRVWRNRVSEREHNEEEEEEDWFNDKSLLLDDNHCRWEYDNPIRLEVFDRLEESPGDKANFQTRSIKINAATGNTKILEPLLKQISASEQGRIAVEEALELAAEFNSIQAFQTIASSGVCSPSGYLRATEVAAKKAYYDILSAGIEYIVEQKDTDLSTTDMEKVLELACLTTGRVQRMAISFAARKLTTVEIGKVLLSRGIRISCKKWLSIRRSHGVA